MSKEAEFPKDAEPLVKLTWNGILMLTSVSAMLVVYHVGPKCPDFDMTCQEPKQTRLQMGTATSATASAVTVLGSQGTLMRAT